MFQFTGFPSIRYGLAYGYMRCAHVGFPIQKSPDHGIFAPPRSLSQLITSFIGSQCQGIRPALFFAWPFRYYSVNIWRLVGLLFLYFVAFATPRFVSISTFNVFLDVLYMQFSRYIRDAFCMGAYQKIVWRLSSLLVRTTAYFVIHWHVMPRRRKLCFRVRSHTASLFLFLTDMFYQPFKHKTSFMLKSLVKPVIITAFPRCIRLHPLVLFYFYRLFLPSAFFRDPAATCFPMPSPA